MHKRIEVPYLDQSGAYPTGCESVSAVMLLQYLGYDISVDTFIEQYLEKEDFEEREGVWYGPDPRTHFCGSPYDEDSFGCYAPVICKALEKILGDVYEVSDRTGTEIDILIREYIDREMPVVFWACINMREPITGPQWKLKETGETFTWISNEHCMLLVGYDEEGYYFNDPYDNNGVIRYSKDVVKDRYKAQHMQAVGVKKTDKKQELL
ncbi:MAG: C39 family peptidase [[Ruminococcus] gnavus]|nr:C39 family peptidase [Mediterraneibacter gnavus]